MGPFACAACRKGAHLNRQAVQKSLSCLLTIGDDMLSPHEELARLDADIANAERRVAEQRMLIKKLVRNGVDATMSQKLLQSMQDTLKDWYAHRTLIRKLYPASSSTSATVR